MEQEHAIILTLLHHNVQVRLTMGGAARALTYKRLMSKIWEQESVRVSSSMQNYIEKYVKASDFLKALVEARMDQEITMLQLQVIMLRFLIELQGYLDYEEIIGLVFRYKMLDVLFDFAGNQSLLEEERQEFCVEFFRYTLQHDMLDYTILLMDNFKEQIFERVDNCVEAIIFAFEKNSLHARLKVHVLE
jgi:hypothetical protein